MRCAGRRELRRWLLQPLFSLDAIRRRQAAVQFLKANLSDLSWLGARLHALTDLPRALARIHGNSVRRSVVIVQSQDASAVRVRLLADTLQHFESLLVIFDRLALLEPVPGIDDGSRLRQLVTPKEDGGLRPRLEHALDEMSQLFDRQLAQRDGIIKPSDGAHASDNTHTRKHGEWAARGGPSPFTVRASSPLLSDHLRCCLPR